MESFHIWNHRRVRSGNIQEEAASAFQILPLKPSVILFHLILGGLDHRLHQGGDFGFKIIFMWVHFCLSTHLIRSLNPPKPLTHRLGWLFYNLHNTRTTLPTQLFMSLKTHIYSMIYTYLFCFYYLNRSFNQLHLLLFTIIYHYFPLSLENF